MRRRSECHHRKPPGRPWSPGYAVRCLGRDAARGAQRSTGSRSLRYVWSATEWPGHGRAWQVRAVVDVERVGSGCCCFPTGWAIACQSFRLRIAAMSGQPSFADRWCGDQPVASRKRWLRTRSERRRPSSVDGPAAGPMSGSESTALSQEHRDGRRPRRRARRAPRGPRRSRSRHTRPDGRGVRRRSTH